MTNELLNCYVYQINDDDGQSVLAISINSATRYVEKTYMIKGDTLTSIELMVEDYKPEEHDDIAS